MDIKKIDGQYEVQYVTENKILDALLADLAETKKGDKIWLGMFFVAKRDIINALIDAANRGVDVNIILDPNENSFGQEKSGLTQSPSSARNGGRYGWKNESSLVQYRNWSISYESNLDSNR